MLRLKALSKTYENKKVLEDITFECLCPELVAVLGPSGSGKSTLLKLISGLVRPDGGGVELNGRDMTGLPPEQRGIVYISQEPSLFTHMTVLDNLCYGADIRGIPRKEITADLARLIRLLELEGLENRYPGALSGGQRQRVAIGRGLAVKPSVLLLDEPFSSLDLALRTSMGQLIRSIRENFEVTIILVTHDPSEAMAFSDRIMLLREGRQLQCGTPEDLYRHPVNLQAGQMLGRLLPLPEALSNLGGSRELPVIELREARSEGIHILRRCYRPESVVLIRTGENAEGAYRVGRVSRDGLECRYELLSANSADGFEIISSQKKPVAVNDWVRLVWV
ncbi:ABC transporter ATP-binding protein [Acidaminobacter sp.]|uniref:ABC transporter ATP-binding protein n=1 Tax=Acidaminobacter sp. TaxID=1872102 RepID=UPI00137E9B17|nr:ABC transporter ATP-binding protein [Acidaminobacter sp.]MDK9711317.1 ABC transporter ATP-binding protein [Acidaminobacter sp.]MZQ97124.1 ATP-binding cassette domain-containing protein [Acidaminobacter sp.]